MSNLSLREVAEVGRDLKKMYKGQERVRWKAVGLTYVFLILSIIGWCRLGTDMPDHLEWLAAFGMTGIGYVLANAFLTRRTGFRWAGWGSEVEIVILGFFPVLWVDSSFFLYLFSGNLTWTIAAFPVLVVVWIVCHRIYNLFTGVPVDKKNKHKQIHVQPGLWFPVKGVSDEPMITKTDFIRRVQTDLFPQLDEKKLKNQKRITWGLSIFFAVLWGTLARYLYQKNNGIDEDMLKMLFFAAVLGVGALSLFYDRFKNKYVFKTKEQLLKWLNIPQMDFFGVGEREIPEERIDKLKELCFLFDRINSNMGMFSAFKKVPQLADLLATELVGGAFFNTETGLAFENEKARAYEGVLTIPNGKNNTTLFQGLLIEVKLNRTFSSPIVFTKRQLFHWENGLAKVRLQRSDSYFDVYAWSEREATSLYYSGVADKLRRVNDIFNVDKIAASFYQDKLYIALYTKKDLFEPIGSRFHDVQRYEAFYDEIVQIKEYCAQFKDI